MYLETSSTDLTNLWAVLWMSVVFFVALLGVLALGWYVIYCDRLNRANELEAEGADLSEPPPPAHPTHASRAQQEK
jgi:hypothetical protein